MRHLVNCNGIKIVTSKIYRWISTVKIKDNMSRCVESEGVACNP